MTRREFTAGAASSVIRLPFSSRDIDIELARRKLRYFAMQAWPIVEPASTFIPNWHFDAVCDHLQAVSDGHIQNLIINIPPGHAKSLTVSVLFQPWKWLANPAWRSLFASYDKDLSVRDSVKSRTLLTDPWYQQSFKPKWRFAGDMNVKSYYQNTFTGFRISLSVGGKGTGFRGNCIVVDDPLNAKETHSDTALDEVIFWWDHVMYNRLNNMEKDTRIIMMQRLAVRDLVGHVKARGDNYVLLRLPTRFEMAERCRTFVHGNLFFEDPRKTEGELLFPALFSQAVVDDKERKLGPDGFAAQEQQRPTRMGGGLLKRKFWNYFRPKDVNNLPPVRVMDEDGSYFEKQAIELPDNFDGALDSWDCSFKDEPKNDYVVGGKVAWKGPQRFILNVDRDRRDLDSTLSAMKSLHKWDRWTMGCRTQEVAIEDKANGSSAIKKMRNEVSGVIAIDPEGGKFSRAQAMQPSQVAGDWFLPHPSIAPWVNDFISECSDFPNGAHDDMVDMWSQAGNEIEKRYNGFSKWLQGQIEKPAAPPAEVKVGAVPGEISSAEKQIAAFSIVNGVRNA